YMGGIILSVIALFLSIFLTAFLGSAGVLILIAAAAFLVVFIVQYVRYSNRNIEDRKILTGMKLARIIGVDLKKNTPLDVAISFEDYLKHGKAVAGGKRAGKFVDTWFQARGRLADNTAFNISVEQKVSRKSRAKRKYTKVKEAVQEIVSL